ncbi:MAG: adenine-specific DNA-methyltransferase, partial [Paludibacteraceae bacterium]|nr:adenine-specific DNA-methyltransferase [Paludibacteraceae bacterium]
MEYLGTDKYRIIHGDALQALKTDVKDNSVDLIFAVTPYNIGKNFAGCLDKWDTDEHYLEWCYQWLDLCVRKLKYNGSFYVMTSTQFMP